MMSYLFATDRCQKEVDEMQQDAKKLQSLSEADFDDAVKAYDQGNNSLSCAPLLVSCHDDYAQNACIVEHEFKVPVACVMHIVSP